MPTGDQYIPHGIVSSSMLLSTDLPIETIPTSLLFELGGVLATVN